MILQKIDCAGDELRWKSDRGNLEIRRPAKGVILFVEVGFLDKEFAPIIQEHLEAMLKGGEQPEIFVDAYDLEGYDSEVRIGATEWLKTNRDKVRKQHMLVRSRLTKMGLSVASMALGGVLEGYADRPSFDRAYRAAVGSGR